MTAARAVDLVGGPALVALVLLLAAFEAAWPLRRRVRPRAERWLTNGAVVAIAALTVRLVAVPLELWAAMRAAEHGIGLTRVLPLPAPVTAARTSTWT